MYVDACSNCVADSYACSKQVQRQTSAIDDKEWVKIFMQPVACAEQYCRKVNLGAVLQREQEETVDDCSDSKGLKYCSHSTVGMGRREHLDGLVLSGMRFSFSRNIG